MSTVDFWSKKRLTSQPLLYVFKYYRPAMLKSRLITIMGINGLIADRIDAIIAIISITITDTTDREETMIPAMPHLLFLTIATMENAIPASPATSVMTERIRISGTVNKAIGSLTQLNRNNTIDTPNIITIKIAARIMARELRNGSVTAKIARISIPTNKIGTRTPNKTIKTSEEIFINAVNAKTKVHTNGRMNPNRPKTSPATLFLRKVFFEGLSKV